MDASDEVAMEMFEPRDPSGDNPLGAPALLGAWDHVDDKVIDKFIADIYRTRPEGTARCVHLEL